MYRLPLIAGLGLLITAATLRAWAVEASAEGAAAPQGPELIYLWPAGHPTLQGADEKEITDPPDARPGQLIRSIKNVHNPLIEVRLAPADKANGTAVVVAPGGGHERLVWDSEGEQIARWLNNLGIHAFIL